MSLETVLKNVYNFLDVLQTAFSDRVSSWDRKMVDNAVRWAVYGQQMYVQASGKPYEAQLDKQIQHLGQLPWVLGEVDVNLNLLKNAETLMKETLLQNPWLPDETFEYVLGLYDVSSKKGLSTFVQVCQKLNKDKSGNELIHKITCFNMPDMDIRDDKSDRAKEAQARLLLIFVKRALIKTQDHKKERTLAFLKKNITSFAKKTGAMRTVAQTLQGKYPDILVSAEEENDVKTVILQSVLGLPQHLRQELKPLLTPRDSTP